MILKAIEDRFSVRKFKNIPIEEDKLNAILKAAQLSPSAKNVQPWKFVVIKDKQMRDQLPAICKGQKFVSQAPVTIAVCCNNLGYIMTCGQKTASVDGAIVGAHITLQAVELGLGSCWIGAFYQDKMAKLINLPDEFEVIALFPIGYPDIEKGKRNLKSISEIVVYDRF
ncbi:MAG: nitroreductase family protein [Candidatus Cloacimonetes bacterium]|nr:nitroreductase family protein [Candidatus Cloacimonadota bacterium]